MQATISEDASVGARVAQVGVIGAHSGEVKYWLEGDTAQMTIDSITGNIPLQLFVHLNVIGVISIAQPLDYEQYQLYELTVAVAPMSSPTTSSLIDRCNVFINITDVNDNSPHLIHNPVYLTIIENLPGPYPIVIGRVNAIDVDSGAGGKLTYSIIRGNSSAFSVDASSGQISALMAFDQEVIDEYLLDVMVADSGLLDDLVSMINMFIAGVPRLSTTAQVVVTVSDENDNVPIFDNMHYAFDLVENAAIGATVGRVIATDADQKATARVLYVIQ